MTLEERIKQLLAESENKRQVENSPNKELDSLTEDDLDRMSASEINKINVDQLDEISKEKLDRHIKKVADYKSKQEYDDEYLADKKNKYNPKGADYKKVSNKLNKSITEDSTTSSQVASLLESEGLSEEFKLQAVTIFEAAVSDRVLQLTEEMEKQFDERLDEAKSELENNIDGFLNETVQRWATDNEVAIQNNFKTRLAESFMDGLHTLLVEHGVDLPAESENALDIALDQINVYEEEVDRAQAMAKTLYEQVVELKSGRILESFKEKMTSTEFDRFAQLTESVGYTNDSQYEKQLNIVLENFGKQSIKPVRKPVIDQLTESVTTDGTNSAVNRYAAYMQSKVK